MTMTMMLTSKKKKNSTTMKRRQGEGEGEDRYFRWAHYFRELLPATVFLRLLSGGRFFRKFTVCYLSNFNEGDIDVNCQKNE